MGELFETYDGKEQGGSSHRLLFISALAIPFLVGAVYLAFKFMPESTPYDSLLHELKPGMSEVRVENILVGREILENRALEWKHQRRPYPARDIAPVDPDADNATAYRVAGSDLPLVVEFKHGSAYKWCMFVPLEGRTGEPDSKTIRLTCKLL